VIELDGIERVFHVGEETVHALRDVHLSIGQGDYVAIMGPSGSGKSTLLNIIGLLDRPDSGVYRLGDVDTTELTDNRQAALRRHRIGFVFQFFHLVPRLTAFENVEMPLMLARVESSRRKKKVKDALSAFGLGDRMQHRPDQLSGGQRQRVAIARATIMAPSIILADEPTGNLDQASGNDVIRILEGLNRQNITLVMVTHDQELGKRAGRRITMRDGAVLHGPST
jgi:putative ABC transport system ATP-binding protein